jgi:hypothetical protein
VTNRSRHCEPKAKQSSVRGQLIGFMDAPPEIDPGKLQIFRMRFMRLDKIKAVAIGRIAMQVDGSRADFDGKAKTGLTG